MKTTLDLKDRIMILNLLPPEGNIITLRLLRDLSKKVGITAEETAEYEVRGDGKLVLWNVTGNVPKEFEFADAEFEIIKTQLDKKNELNQLHPDMISIYEKFHP